MTDLRHPDLPSPVGAAAEASRRLAVLGHPARLAILRLLLARGDEGARVAAIAQQLGVSPGRVRSHCGRLEGCGLVERRAPVPPRGGRGRFVAVASAVHDLAGSLSTPLLGLSGPFTAGDSTTPDQQPASTALSSDSTDQRLLLLSRVAEQVGDGVAVTDSDGWFVFTNPAFDQMHRYPRGDLIGRHFSILYSQDASPDAVHRLIADALQHGVGRVETTRARADGSTFPVAVTLSLLHDQAGALIGRVQCVQDITERQALQQRLREEALHDPLTGLPNRRLLLDRLQQALLAATRSGEPISVLFGDLDGFKPVNDQYGHDIGDQVLTQVAARLREQLRPADTLARIGGDEFVAVLTGTTPDQGEEIAERLRRTLDTPIQIGHRHIRLGLSVGVCTDHTGTAERLLTGADAAMYRDKTTHRESAGRPSRHLTAVPHRSATS